MWEARVLMKFSSGHALRATYRRMVNGDRTMGGTHFPAGAGADCGPEEKSTKILQMVYSIVDRQVTSNSETLP